MAYPGAWYDLFMLGVWVVGLLFLIGLLWAATEAQVTRDQQEKRQLAMNSVVALTNTYAAQLEQLGAQMDRLTLSIAHEWNDAPSRLNLPRDRLRGLFPHQHNFFIAVIDASGRLVHTSFAVAKEMNFSGVDFFREHAAACCEGLLISGPDPDSLAGTPFIRFSRRLQRPDGRFAGVVVISAAPDFMVTQQDESQQGENDFVTARLEDGTFLATRLGHGVRVRRVFYREPPVFGAEQGVRFERGARFVDGRDRYIAWQKVPPYRLVAISGVTEEFALAGHLAVARGYRVAASIATLFLSLLALAGIAISLHVGKRRRAEENVRHIYRVATDAANEGFYMLSPILGEHGELKDIRFEDCNDRAAALLGMARTQLVGCCAKDAMPSGSRTELLSICAKALEGGLFEDEMRVPARGWLRATWVYRRAVHSGSGIALTLRDISDLKVQEQALADIANNDALTQLPNRRWLQGFLPAAVRRAKRGHSRVALLFIDLDNFKAVNDTLGHAAGDGLLRQAAIRISETVRASDRVARLGGDEFTVVLENVDSNESVEKVAAAIIQRLTEPYDVAGLAGSRVSASVGISLFPDHSPDADSLLKHADVAMYAAKGRGKGQHCFYDASLSEALMQRLVAEHALRQAVGRGEFVVHYQPRVSTATGQLSSVEALVRWQHPQRGLLMPSEFISVAEDAGLIVPISEIVITQVGAQLAQWREQGVPPVPVSVNVSPRQLQEGGTAAFLTQMLRHHHLPVSLLEVEITESAMVDRGPVISRELEAIRALGIRMMIDDFGTGYSSLAQLHRLDVDVLKVDQAFTHTLAENAEGELLYRAIVSMATALGMRVVAEGVETVEQLRLLQLIGCDEIQGFIIAPALPAEGIAELSNVDCLNPYWSGVASERTRLIC